MKVAVSIPDEAFEDGERACRRLRIPRSRLYADAVRAYARKHSGDDVTCRLDAVHADFDSALDAEWEAESLEAIGPERW